MRRSVLALVFTAYLCLLMTGGVVSAAADYQYEVSPIFCGAHNQVFTDSPLKAVFRITDPGTGEAVANAVATVVINGVPVDMDADENGKLTLEFSYDYLRQFGNDFEIVIDKVNWTPIDPIKFDVLLHDMTWDEYAKGVEKNGELNTAGSDLYLTPSSLGDMGTLNHKGDTVTKRVYIHNRGSSRHKVVKLVVWNDSTGGNYEEFVNAYIYPGESKYVDAKWEVKSRGTFDEVVSVKVKFYHTDGSSPNPLVTSGYFTIKGTGFDFDSGGGGCTVIQGSMNLPSATVNTFIMILPAAIFFFRRMKKK